MAFPDFFETAPTLRLRDPLAQLLGASHDGMIEYRYADAVRLAGHSCPTVAGAYLMGRAAMNALYPDELPERGNVDVTLPDAEDTGVTGVIAQVLTLLTGAAAANGFKGLGGHHARCRLLHFDADQPGNAVTFHRRDNGASVNVHLDLSSIPPHPGQRPLLSAIMQGHLTNEQRTQFGRLWQDRVRRLLEHADDREVICVATA